MGKTVILKLQQAALNW